MAKAIPLEVEIPEFAYLYYAVLVVYRAAGGDPETGVQAICFTLVAGAAQSLQIASIILTSAN